MSSPHAPASKRKKIVLLCVLLGIVPVGFLVMRTGKHTFKKLPYIGEREVNAPGDTTFWTVPPFSFTDQNGRPFTNKDVEGKVVIADFFFTRCGSICPRMSLEMQQLQFKLDDPAFKEVVFLSHTVDPEHDTPDVLREYARKMQADTVRWKFLTGDAKTIYRQGNIGYLLSAGPNADSTAAEQFVHSPQFVLVDMHQHIRGMYDGTVTSSVDSLVVDLKMLLKEEHLRMKREREAAAQ
ncbi:MAG TPA: SCO family protein [Flavobacteriales bacterium]|nr:SCO family protein [Flavobacteriales bacterium]